MCSPGRYQTETGQVDCLDCPAGTMRAPNDDDDAAWTNGNNKHVAADMVGDCVVCVAGEYQHMTGRTSCFDCPAGTRRAVATSKDGMEWDGSGNNLVANLQSDCTVCEEGRYQHLTGQTSCMNCPQGTRRAHAFDYDGWDGSSEASNNDVADEKGDCKVCEGGQYQISGGSPVCIDCPAGTWRLDAINDNQGWDNANNNLAAIYCTVCSAGEYQHEAGKTGCNGCPAGTRRNPNSDDFYDTSNHPEKDGAVWDGVGYSFSLVADITSTNAEALNSMYWTVRANAIQSNAYDELNNQSCHG